MDYPLSRLDNGTIEITLTVPWDTVRSAYEQAVTQAIAAAEISGFRKGKAPRDLVEPKLDKTKLYSESIQTVLPSVYKDAITSNHLQPLIQPHLSLVKGEEGQTWEFLATLCEAPVVTLPADYKTELTKLSKEPKDTKLSRILEYLTSKTPFQVPDPLVEEEANHRLSALIENITQLGLTSEKYLEAKKLTPETLKANLASESRTDLAIEFILNQVRTDEKLADRAKTLEFLQSLV